jgi:SAM-dependent methyltransferase
VDLREAEQQQSLTRHPWEQARADFVVRTLRRAGCRGHVLDIGAGDTYVARTLQQHGIAASVDAIDASYTDAQLLAFATTGIRCARVVTDDVRPADITLLLDVLEHVEDDTALLATAAAHTAEGGAVLITVPAWPKLFAEHDRQLHHVRRYTRCMLLSLVERAGLSLDEDGGFFTSLLLPRAFNVLRERVRPPATSGIGVAAWRHGPLATALVTGALRADATVGALLRRRHGNGGLFLPGLSHFALCRKVKAT